MFKIQVYNYPYTKRRGLRKRGPCLCHAALAARLGNECTEFCCVHTIASRCRFVYKASITPCARGRNRRAAGMGFLRVCTHSTICLPGFLRRGVWQMMKNCCRCCKLQLFPGGQDGSNMLF